MSKANLTRLRRLPMVALPRQKRGLLCRLDPPGSGYEVDGGDRRPRSPLGNYLDAASSAELGWLDPTLEQIAVPRPGRGRSRKNPTRLSDDKAAAANPLRTRLARRGIELIGPHRKNRKKPPTQDGRPLRRYKKR